MGRRKSLVSGQDAVQASSGHLQSPENESTAVEGAKFSYCALTQVPERQLPANLDPVRHSLIRMNEMKWANGTVLHYYFFNRQTDGESVLLRDGSSRWVPWFTKEAEKQIVREAFRRWKEVGIGLEFEEVDSPEKAEIRIGFMRGNGSWSYIGRDVLEYGPKSRTMNFGWDLTADAAFLDTAIHEIGHTLGFPHEHQNPKAGIVWNEDAVYAYLAGPPNWWSQEEAHFNVIRKLEPSSVQGSAWDPDSIMHYPFKPGLIKSPKGYCKTGLFPAGGISEQDKATVRSLYPPVSQQPVAQLRPHQSESLGVSPGEQKNFAFSVSETREYELQTYGRMDAVMVLFDETAGKFEFLSGDDDSGAERNASLRVRLTEGRRYVLAVRMIYEEHPGQASVMLR
ncbi:hypothetical protein BHS06_17225 [Myxococcus xanthus]|nr:hypothetical protein BHS06_17225 [Myxococcus xanthus]